MLTRHQFLFRAAGTGVALAAPWSLDLRRALAYNHSLQLQKFSQPLRGVGPGGIPVAAPDSFLGVGKATHYSVTVGQYTDRLHPSLDPTTLWGYNPVVPLGGGRQPQRHLGGIIVAQRDKPIQLTVTNMLPKTHILPVDSSTNYSGILKRQNAITTHLHCGGVPWTSDGGPFSWFTPDGKYGESVMSSAGNIYKLLNPNLRAGQGEYYYPNNQSARMMWYHDHAMDITRLNAHAGIASAYIIRDSFESNLRNMGLPDFVENGGREIPISIQDKVIVGPDLARQDPTWPKSCPQTVASLWYPHMYEDDKWDEGPHPHSMTERKSLRLS